MILGDDDQDTSQDEAPRARLRPGSSPHGPDAGAGWDEDDEADRWLREQLGAKGALDAIDRALQGHFGAPADAGRMPAAAEERPRASLQAWLDGTLDRADEDPASPGGGLRGLHLLGGALVPDRFVDDATVVPASLDAFPFRCPEGYYREVGPRGRWRYTRTGGLVPGAVDLTIGRLWRFETDTFGNVAVPTRLAMPLSAPEPIEERRFWADELGWARSWAPEHLDILRPGPGRPAAQQVVWVPRTEWEARSRRSIGILAPELDVTRLADINTAGALLDLSRSSVTTYLARKRFPPPVLVVANSPLWSIPVLLQWNDTRPGQGRHGGPKPGRKRTRRQPKPDVNAFLENLRQQGPAVAPGPPPGAS